MVKLFTPSLLCCKVEYNINNWTRTHCSKKQYLNANETKRNKLWLLITSYSIECTNFVFILWMLNCITKEKERVFAKTFRRTVRCVCYTHLFFFFYLLLYFFLFCSVNFIIKHFRNSFVSPALTGKTLQGSLCPLLLSVVCCCCEHRLTFGSTFHILRWISTKVRS